MNKSKECNNYNHGYAHEQDCNIQEKPKIYKVDCCLICKHKKYSKVLLRTVDNYLHCQVYDIQVHHANFCKNFIKEKINEYKD